MQRSILINWLLWSRERRAAKEEARIKKAVPEGLWPAKLKGVMEDSQSRVGG